MPFRISGKNLDVGDALRQRVNDRIIEALQKYFISKMPRLVAMYLLAVTRDTVDSCMEMASATVLRLSGRRWRTPRAKNASC